jgi:hypothetical protein
MYRPLRMVCLLALLMAGWVCQAAPDLVLDETGTLSADQTAQIQAAQAELRETGGVSAIIVLLPQLSAQEASERKDGIISRLRADRQLPAGPFGIFFFSGKTSLSLTSTRSFDALVTTELVSNAWSAPSADMALPERIVAFLRALRRSVSGSGAAAQEPVEPPAGPRRPPTPHPKASFAVTPLTAADLTPSDQPQTVSAGGRVRVTVPGGVVQEPTRLTIGAVGELPPVAQGGFQSLGTFEVSLGDRHEFAQDLTIEVPYDPAALGGVPAEEVLALRWDDDLCSWVELPFRADEARRSIVARTRHLSILTFVYKIEIVLYNSLWENFAYTAIRVRNFRLYYDVPTLMASKLVSGWRPETNPDMEFGYLYTYDNPNWLPFVRDVAYYLEKAYKAYLDVPLTALGKIPVVVKLAPDAAGQNPACYDYATNRMYVSSNRRATRDEIKHSLAHELFHAMQLTHVDYNAKAPYADSAQWFTEASAEYASCRIPWKLDLMGGSTDSIYPYLLEYPIAFTGVPKNPHGIPGFSYNEVEYDRGYLLDYMVDHGRAPFGPLFKQAMDAIAAEAKAWFSSSTNPAVSACDAHLKKVAGRGLSDVYRDFAAWFLLSDACPLARSLTPEPEACLDNPGRQPADLPLMEVSDATGARRYWKVQHAMALPRGYTARVYAVKPAMADKQAARPLVVKATRLSNGALLDLYVGPEKTRVPGQPQRQGTITEENKGFLVDVPRGHVLYVIALNPGDQADAEASVEVTDYTLTLGIEINGVPVGGAAP